MVTAEVLEGGGLSELVKKVKTLEQGIGGCPGNQAEGRSVDAYRPSIYFRGQQDGYGLLPSLLRDGAPPSPAWEENNLFCHCHVMGSQELEGAGTSWEKLGLLRHYGFHTRLLDWTSSLISAIFFATCKCLECRGLDALSGPCDLNDEEREKRECPGKPIVWVLNPKKMHETLHTTRAARDARRLTAFTVGVDDLQDYARAFVRTNGPERWRYRNGPIFVEMPWNASRIRAQKGYFTFHGEPVDGRTPLECLKGASKFLGAIALDEKATHTILEEFMLMNVSEFDMYPDLSHLAIHMGRVLELSRTVDGSSLFSPLRSAKA